jgi:LuxR family transcriptional regulator, maltose regulon positive regulatory protein
MASMPADAALSDQRKSLGGQPEHLEVLSKAIGDLAASRPPFAHEVMVRLADLRRRQGRIEEAERLFREAESHPMAAVAWPSCRWIAMSGGAIPVAEQVLRHLPLANKTQRAAALELAVRAKSPGLGH